MHEAAKLVRQEELLNLLLLRISLRQCAERLNISYQTVRKYASEPDFLNNLRLLSQSIYEDVVKDLKTEKKTMAEKMTEASEKALERLTELINSPQEGISLKACDSLLDRNVETARNRKETVEGSHRFTIDPVTLMHAALTAHELNSVQNPQFERDGGRDDRNTKALPASTSSSDTPSPQNGTSASEGGNSATT